MAAPNRIVNAPFMLGPKGWTLEIPEGSKIEWGHAFDAERGWRVMLGFKDGRMRNSFPAEDARDLAKSIRSQGGDAPRLADALEEMADQVDRLQGLWIAAGRPADHGSAIHTPKGSS